MRDKPQDWVDTQKLIDEGYTDGKKSFEYLLEKLFKVYDFEKVYQVMKALDWHWHTHNEEYGIPRIDTIKKHARKLLYEAYDKEIGRTSTGGFSAGYDNGDLWLSFSIEDWHTSDC